MIDKEYSLKNIVALAVGIMIAIALTWQIARWTAPETTEIKTVPQERKVDSLTNELHATRIKRDDLLDSLDQYSHLTNKFRNEIAEANGTIVHYQQMLGKLRLENDSLQKDSVSVTTSNELIEHRDNAEVGLKDTTLVHHTTWGDSLIGSHSFTYFRNDSVYSDQNIRQLRPVRINQALIVSDDRREVRALTTSPDFENLKVRSFSELQPAGEDTFPWKWAFAGIGFAVGVYVAK